MPQPIIELADVAKSFGGVQAVKGIDLAIDAGQIVGLVGENGAGKSTVIKLLSGVHPPDRGTIKIAGREIRFASPKDALEAGVTTIQQELTCFAHLSIAENLLMGEAWPRQKWGGVDWPALNAEANRRLTEFGLSLETHRTLGELTAAEKQEIAIAGALARPARFVILDEPTASLTEPEVKRLFSHLRRLRSQGVTILYVSHRLDEIFELTDRIIVMRDGAIVASHRTAEVDAPRLVHDMVGRPLEQVYPRTRTGRKEVATPVSTVPLLELSDFTRAGMFRNVSLTVRAGEIVGLAGLVGAGRSELARAIYGLYRAEAGTMRLCGRDWRPAHPRESLRAGLVYVPEERKRQGLVLEHSLAEAIGIGFSDRLTRFGLIPARTQRRRVAEAIKTYDIRASSSRQAIATLSGGNQQKALLARWLERGPEVIILDEPTRGVDVGAKSQIHALVDSLAAKGKGILFISSDLGEIVGMSDRILVMNRGTIETELRGEQMTAHNVILAASGLYQADRAPRQERAPVMSRIPLEGIRFWRRMPKSVQRRIAFLIAANLAILAFIGWRTGASGTSFADEASRMVSNVAPIILAGLGSTGIICCGAIDLSIGSILGLAGTVFGILHARGFGPDVCFAACFATACGVSAYNGLLVRWMRIPAIIVTLAGLAFYRGAALILADVGATGFGEQFTVDEPAYHTPGKDHAGLILIAVLALAVVWECYGKSLRRWLAVGSSEMACRLSGLRPERIVFQAFVVGGLFLGLASLLEVTNHITIEPARLGLGFELNVIAAVVLGGTSIFGGEGSYVGTALGGLFLYLIGPAMLYAGVNEYWRTAVQGGAILAVISIDCALSRKRKLLEELK